MTVQTDFTNWQAGRQPGPPYVGDSPALRSLRDYLLKRWGGQSLGVYGVRAVRAGSSWSSHAFGAALDWRWENPGPGRANLDQDILPWLIDNSRELGIQAIHDYTESRIWRSNRGDGKGAYWKPQANDSAGMGQAWAQWLHIEVTAEAWGDGRPVDEKVQGVTVPKPTLRLGDAGPAVADLTAHLVFFKLMRPPTSTVFTKRVERGVRRLQAEVGVTVDGVYGPGTAAAYKRWLTK